MDAKNLVKTMFFWYQLVLKKIANGEIEIQAYSFIENEDGTEGELQPIPEDSEDEWNMIEEVFNSFMEE